jgi:hypothetical protein
LPVRAAEAAPPSEPTNAQAVRKKPAKEKRTWPRTLPEANEQVGYDPLGDQR